jgi:hypothetical protein
MVHPPVAAYIFILCIYFSDLQTITGRFNVNSSCEYLIVIANAVKSAI